MDSYQIIILPFAELDIRDSVDHYKGIEDGLDIKFIKSINTKISHISKNPYAFPVEKYDIRKAVVDKFPFCIYFVPRTDTIYIMAVFHDKRNPQIWKQRRPKTRRIIK